MVTSPLHPHVTLRSTYKEVIVFFEVPWTAGLNMEIIQSMVLPSGTAAVFFLFFFFSGVYAYVKIADLNYYLAHSMKTVHFMAF